MPSRQPSASKETCCLPSLKTYDWPRPTEVPNLQPLPYLRTATANDLDYVHGRECALAMRHSYGTARPSAMPLYESLFAMPLMPQRDGIDDNDMWHVSAQLQPDGSSQRDIYDVAPPPGYKQLKRIRGTGTGTHEIRSARDDQRAWLHDEAPTGTNARTHTLRRSKRRRRRPRREMGERQVWGDGFSGDEMQRKGTRASTGSTSTATGCGGATSGTHGTTTTGKRKRKQHESLVLGTLEIMSLSQEDKTYGTDSGPVPPAALGLDMPVAAGGGRLVFQATVIEPLRLRPRANSGSRARPVLVWDLSASDDEAQGRQGSAHGDDGDPSAYTAAPQDSKAFLGEDAVYITGENDTGYQLQLPPLRLR